MTRVCQDAKLFSQPRETSGVRLMKQRGQGSIIAIDEQSSLTGRPNTAAVTAAVRGDTIRVMASHAPYLRSTAVITAPPHTRRPGGRIIG